jgi:hypothetical protein
MSDYELDDTTCENCGHYPTHRRECTAIGCEGGTISETDEFYAIPENCDECNGKGYLHWCPQCGEDVEAEEVDKVTA